MFKMQAQRSRPGTTVRHLHPVGQVAQQQARDVQQRSVQRGVMVEINLTDTDAAEQNVLFAGSKPFWWL